MFYVSIFDKMFEEMTNKGGKGRKKVKLYTYKKA
jgi:hypothetical protein